jgi:hypothetical protein
MTYAVTYGVIYKAFDPTRVLATGPFAPQVWLN